MNFLLISNIIFVELSYLNLFPFLGIPRMARGRPIAVPRHASTAPPEYVRYLT